MNTEFRVIKEGTAELQLPRSCPTCEGPVSLRISPDGVRSFCPTCHTIGKPRLGQDGPNGYFLHFPDMPRA